MASSGGGCQPNRTRACRLISGRRPRRGLRHRAVPVPGVHDSGAVSRGALPPALGNTNGFRGVFMTLEQSAARLPVDK